jgi:hypothetical protein
MLSFNDVVNELGISEDELKKLVADNEIRSFHEAGELKFKKEDVNQLKNRLETAPTIVLSDTDSSSLLDDEPLLEEEPTLEEPTLEEPALEEPVLEEQPSSNETTLEEPVLEDAGKEPELDLSGPEEVSPSEETVMDVDGILDDDDDAITLEEPETDTSKSVGDDTVLDSGLGDEDDLSFGLDDTEEDDILGQATSSGGPRMLTPRTQEASPALTGLLVLLALILILPGAILINLASENGGVFPAWITEDLTFLNGVIDTILGWF